MKTIVPLNQSSNKFLLIVSVLLFSLNTQAQSGQSINPGLNFSADPVLIAGTGNQAGSIYKYKNVAPGLDAMVTIDSLVGGATVSTIDDNSGHNGGYVEGFQPQITSGPAAGISYAVFTIGFKMAGTNEDQRLDTVSLTALDIDGTKTLKEFDQVSLGSGATAWYMGSNPTISLTRMETGTFMAVNTDGVTRNGVDTSAKSNMFTITNTHVSSFTLKLGISNDHSTKTLRLFSIYMKGFNYPDMAVMPVTLQYFTANLNNSGAVNVDWTTATQSNVSHFVVQRSLDGRNFSDAGVVFPEGNSSSAVNYNFTDKTGSVKSNAIFYRLCSIDLDGRSQYSGIITVRMPNTIASGISIITYPNPSSNQLRVTIPAAWQNKNVTYELYNVYGQLSKSIEEQSSPATQTMNVRQLPTGMYILKVLCQGQSFMQKVIKF